MGAKSFPLWLLKSPPVPVQGALAKRGQNANKTNRTKSHFIQKRNPNLMKPRMARKSNMGPGMVVPTFQNCSAAVNDPIPTCTQKNEAKRYRRICRD